MAKKKPTTPEADRHPPGSITIRLKPEFRALLERITAATGRTAAAETQLALNHYAAMIEAKIKAGHFDLTVRPSDTRPG